MKSCPFCAEEIQAEAIKCKHCGEWLDDSKKPQVESFAEKIFTKSSSFIQEQKQKIQEKRMSHLFVPDDKNPFELNGFYFYSNYFKSNSEVYKYSDIVSIKYFSSVSKTNLITTETQNDFFLFLDLGSSYQYEDRFSKNAIDLSTSSFFGIGSGKKTREKMSFLQQYLKKITFENRAALYLKQIHESGFFHYPKNFKFHNNGNIEKDGKIISNLVEAARNDLLNYGDMYFRSFAGRSQYYNPYSLIIWPPKSSSRWIFSSKIEIEVLYDKDVFSALLMKLLKDGAYV